MPTCPSINDPAGPTCPSVAFRADGVAVSYDPATHELTMHESPRRVVPLAFAQLDDSRLVHVGPDAVAYLTGRSPGLDDPIG